MACSRKLLQSSTHFRPIPLSVRNSLRRSIHLNAPFSPKDLTGLTTDLLKSYFDKGLIEEAHSLFDEMHHRDVIAWTAMVTGYVSCNQYTRAWNMFSNMLKDGVNPNAFTVSSVLKACKGLKALSRGELVHGLAIKIGTQGSSIYVDNALVGMYATCCDSMDNARLVFEDIVSKNAVSWTTLITGYTHRRDSFGGLRVFRQMFMEEGELSPFSFSIAVSACAAIGSSNLGVVAHLRQNKYSVK
ncbi:hypothetical protein TSUD_35130 [Trifolium subterraneum]|uniref:Pentatricopeptide repeat-containing protein n=1 Tax=Trifolium subterraneum TaxID=3900 RepID=A0A2Z6MEG2_TRISU|nr:hypothetical protein TSUD_35130 [Trifolium subterraneum]